jgi:hypothetical protein
MEPRCRHGWIMPASQCPDCSEIDRLRAENATLLKRNQSTYCAFCGEFFEADADPDGHKTDAVQNHIKSCPKHPMREVERENDARKRIIELQGALTDNDDQYNSLKTHKDAEIDRLRAELKASASMLGQQCDLARAAEIELDSLIVKAAALTGTSQDLQSDACIHVALDRLLVLRDELAQTRAENAALKLKLSDLERGLKALVDMIEVGRVNA